MKKLLLLLPLLCGMAWAQNSAPAQQIVVTNSINQPLGGVSVEICNTTASQSPSCTSAATIYSDTAGAHPITCTGPSACLTTDGLGQVPNFFAAPGYYCWVATAFFITDTTCHLINLSNQGTGPFGNVAFLNVIQSWTAAQTFGANVNLSTINGNIIKVDAESGSDICAKINTCIAALPAGGGICDARAITGAQTCAATATCNVSDSTILLGPVKITSSANPIFNLSSNRCALKGMPEAASSILFTSSATGNVINVPCNSCDVENLAITSASGTTRTAGAGINLTGGAATISNIKFSAIWNGILNQGQGNFTNIEYGTPAGSPSPHGSGDNSGIYVGPTVCCTTSSNYNNLVISASWTEAGIVVDSGSDSQNFHNLEMSCGANGGNIHIENTLAGYVPTLIDFSDGAIEACGTGVSIKVDSCAECTFSNIHSGCAGGLCSNGLVIASGGVGEATYIGGTIQNTNQECVKVTGSSATNVNIIGTTIADCGQQTNNTYASANISAGVSGVKFIGDTFKTYGSLANLPSNNVLIGSGSGDNIIIADNTWGDNSGTAVSQGATGVNVRVMGNSGSGTKNENTGPQLLEWQCTGTGSNAAQTNNIGLIVQACNVSNSNNYQSVASPGIYGNLRAFCNTAGHGAGSGIVTLNQGGVTSGITCTIGTGTSCTDLSHRAQFLQNPSFQITLTSVVGETLADCTFSVEKF